MKKELLALVFIAALPGCGCWRKDTTTKKDKPKKEMADKSKKKSGGKELMDMESAY